jgi:hypothetical protein
MWTYWWSYDVTAASAHVVRARMQREHVLKHALCGGPAPQCYALR